MSAFVVVDIDVQDGALMQQYADAAEKLVAQYGGRRLARSYEPLPLEGDWRPSSMALFEFPDKSSVYAFYESEEYRSILPTRLLASSIRGIVILDGDVAPAT